MYRRASAVLAALLAGLAGCDLSLSIGDQEPFLDVDTYGDREIEIDVRGGESEEDGAEVGVWLGGYEVYDDCFDCGYSYGADDDYDPYSGRGLYPF